MAQRFDLKNGLVQTLVHNIYDSKHKNPASKIY